MSCPIRHYRRLVNSLRLTGRPPIEGYEGNTFNKFRVTSFYSMYQLQVTLEIFIQCLVYFLISDFEENIHSHIYTTLDISVCRLFPRFSYTVKGSFVLKWVRQGILLPAIESPGKCSSTDRE